VKHIYTTDSVQSAQTEPLSLYTGLVSESCHNTSDDDTLVSFTEYYETGIQRHAGKEQNFSE